MAARAAAAAAESEPEPDADRGSLGIEAAGPDGFGADPDLAPAPVLAQPVPLVVEVQRDGKTWLLQSESRRIALTLDSLRCLRGVPGTGEMTIRATLPAAPAAPRRRFFGQG